MTVKVLVTALGQQIVAGAKQIENKETQELVGYWLENPRVVGYTRNEDGEISVNFGPYCMVSDEQAFSLRSDHVVAILEPRADVSEAYSQLVSPADAPTEELNDEAPDDTNSDSVEGSDATDSVDGAA